MLAKLKGRITDIFADFLILTVGDVGYRVETVSRDFIVDQEVELYIYTHVRENEIRLFGMKSKEQYLLFIDLIAISGLGPKLALTILDQLSYDTILSAVAAKNSETLKVKGVGKKTAERIVIEMSSKLEKYNWQNSTVVNGYSEDFLVQSKDALKNLGFSHNEIASIMREYGKTDQTESLESLIKFALKFINKK